MAAKRKNRARSGWAAKLGSRRSRRAIKRGAIGQARYHDIQSGNRKRQGAARRAIAAEKANPAVKMRKAPKGWMKAKAVRVVRRGGRQVVEVKR